MAVQTEAQTKRYRGLSTDAKPGLERESGQPQKKPPVGSVFTEIDTGRRYVYTDGGSWERMQQTVETLLLKLLDVNEQILARLDATHRGHEEYLWEENAELED